MFIETALNRYAHLEAVKHANLYSRRCKSPRSQEE